LFIGGQDNPPPREYVELQLCREFHVLPSQLRAERMTDIYAILRMMEIENRVKARGKQR
jgi:hypothetical protein